MDTKSTVNLSPLLFLVPEYDIAFPKHVDKRGQQISSYNAKREIEETGLKYYHLTAFNKNLHLKVSLNKHLLGPGFHVETRHKDGSRTITDALHRNFYHGHVVDHPGSFVALSDNSGVSGAIRLVDDEILYMEPVPRHLLDHIHHDEHLPHLVVKKTEKDFQRENKVMFDTEEIHHRDEAPLLRKELKNNEEIDDDENGHRFYEIIYVGDHLIAQEIGMMELPDMLLIIANIVSRMYTDSSFGEIKLHYIVTKVLILNNGELNYTRDASNGVKLDHFGSWLQKHNPKSDADPQHVDAGTLFTSLGGGHDGSTDECPNGANLMSTYVSSGKACFTWSNCSRKWVQNYLRLSRSFCMRDAPTINPPAIPSYIKHNLPGSIFDGNKQCQYSLENPAAQQCVNTCGSLYCTDGGSCWWRGGAPAEGTPCGENKWCIRGECVDNGSPPIDGNWESWSKYSECSRTCGVGIQYRTRKCNNPSPQRGGKPCLEPSKTRKERTCNTHACPSDSQPFRKMQCESVNANYTYYIRSGS
ncbi:A disintegrin and metallo ase with thrombospondin motifs 16-like, partial [Paramuricea clavata]